MIGQKFGRLLVVSQAPSKHKRAQWNCLCDCGNTCVANGKFMRQGKKRSCGCLRSEINKEKVKKLIAGNVLPDGEAAFNLLYASYRCAAYNRDLDFFIEKPEFKELTQKNCFYCGKHPSVTYKSSLSGGYLYNGIDRRDNFKGYVEGNVVPCCKYCNWMKNAFEEKLFLQHCADITEFQKQSSSPSVNSDEQKPRTEHG